MKAFRPSFLFALFMLFLFSVPVRAQDSGGSGESGDFGFGDFGSGESESGFGFSEPSGLSVTVSGKVQAELKSFFDDFDSAEAAEESSLGDIFLGSLNFEAAGSRARAVINLNLAPVYDNSSPVEIDEAYVGVFFGSVTVEGGLRKLTWGKADSFGPLDVVNPLDYTDLTKLSSPQSIKMASPMIHASWSLGSFSKLEAVFVPVFQGHKFATEGRWAPGQIQELVPSLAGGLKTAMTEINPGLAFYFPRLDEWQNNFNVENYYWNRSQILKYAQAGTRFTTTIGSSDLGFQYYFGRLPRPSVDINVDDFFYELAALPPQFDPNKISINIDYNRYHQIGMDFARVIAGFNIRAEAGANITNDLDGTDGALYNPALVWSLGFDRDLFWRVNLNLQGTGQVRLFHDKIRDNAFDCEAGSDRSSSRITGIISRKFFREELELKTSALWGIEDKDFLIIPAVIWSRDDAGVEISSGFFGGDEEGELGQYSGNSFVRLILFYRF